MRLIFATMRLSSRIEIEHNPHNKNAALDWSAAFVEP